MMLTIFEDGGEIVEVFIFLVLVIGVLLSLNFVVATNCWIYDDDETTCDATSDCIYHSES